MHTDAYLPELDKSEVSCWQKLLAWTSTLTPVTFKADCSRAHADVNHAQTCGHLTSDPDTPVDGHTRQHQGSGAICKGMQHHCSGITQHVRMNESLLDDTDQKP